MEKAKEVKLSTKGQIVIPQWVREKFDLGPGDRLLLELKEDMIILRPAIKLSKLRGIDRINEASEKLDKLRSEWDEEFDVRH